jgi:branched-chain amino acid transport system permease protein
MRARSVPAWVVRAIRCVAPAACVIAFQVVMYPIPLGLALQGVVIGLLGALVAVGMALVYRSNGILNFAQVELGLAPTVLSVSLITYSAVNYFLALAIGIAGAVLVGAIVELAIIRRFFRSPRLILTVATIGLSQLLVGAALFIPMIWDAQPLPIIVHIPINFQFTVNPLVFTADHLAAIVVAPLCLFGVALLLRYTSIGIAVRASAERADRASMLGVPVKRLETIVWVLAAVLSFIGIFLQAGILGIPVDATFNYTVLLSALAALVLGNFVNLPTIALSAVALGVLQQGVLWDQINDPQLIDAVLAVVVIVAILVRRAGTSRLEAGSVSTWSVSDAVRPVPIELRRLREVQIARAALGALAATAVLALPWLLSGNAGNQLKATAVVVFVMIALSVTILTGWAGQVSLGQMSFVGFGGAVGAYCTQTLHLDLSIALLGAGMAGAIVATIVSLPALRRRGFFPAVITLAFAMASSAYLLNPQYFSWIPTGQVTRPRLFGLLSLTSEPGFYYFTVVCLALVVLGLRGIRGSRTGRVLMALRENEQAAQSFGVHLLRAKVTAFAISGFVAGIAGCLLVHLLEAFNPAVFGTDQSILVFITAVFGGLGSMLGAVLGAIVLQGGQWFLPAEWQILASGAGVVLILMVLPGGLNDIVFRTRDYLLRRVALRHGVLVPSLLEDRAPPPGSVVADTGHLDAADPVVAPAALHHLVEEEAGL